MPSCRYCWGNALYLVYVLEHQFVSNTKYRYWFLHILERTIWFMRRQTCQTVLWEDNHPPVALWWRLDSNLESHSGFRIKLPRVFSFQPCIFIDIDTCICGLHCWSLLIKTSAPPPTPSHPTPSKMWKRCPAYMRVAYGKSSLVWDKPNWHLDKTNSLNFSI